MILRSQNYCWNDSRGGVVTAKMISGYGKSMLEKWSQGVGIPDRPKIISEMISGGESNTQKVGVIILESPALRYEVRSLSRVFIISLIQSLKFTGWDFAGLHLPNHILGAWQSLVFQPCIWPHKEMAKGGAKTALLGCLWCCGSIPVRPRVAKWVQAHRIISWMPMLIIKSTPWMFIA